jgi:hypothetical protein
MQQTLWSIDFGSKTEWQERGIVVFWKKRMFGGTDATQFSGKFKKNGKKVTGTLSIVKTGKNPIPALRGKNVSWPLKLKFEGNYDNEEIRLSLWDSKDSKRRLEKHMLFRCRNRMNLA